MINAEQARALGTPEAQVKYHLDAIERRVLDVARARTSVAYMFNAKTSGTTIENVASSLREAGFVVTANEVELEGHGSNWVQHIEIRIDWEERQ